MSPSVKPSERNYGGKLIFTIKRQKHWGKGEIARYEQFLFLQCFYSINDKLSSKIFRLVCVRIHRNLIVTTKCHLASNHLREIMEGSLSLRSKDKSIVEEGEIARYEQFLLFLQCFSPINNKLSPKICRLVKCPNT